MPRPIRPTARLLFTAAAMAATAARADTNYVGFSNSIWSAPLNWDNGVPADGSFADVFRSVNVNFNFSSANTTMPAAIQVAGATGGSTATITLTPIYAGAYMKANALLLGGTVTGTTGGATGAGSGGLLQLTGIVYLSAGSSAYSLMIDPTSSYSLIDGTLQSGNESVAGAFAQTGGTNTLGIGSALNVSSSGSYNLGGGLLSVDTVNNAGTFVLNSGSFVGAATASGTLTNTGVVTATSGSFTGNLINQPGGLVTVVGTSPFANVVDNGRLSLNSATGSFNTALTGAGFFVLNGGTVTVNGTNSFTGTTSVNSGTMTLNSPAGALAGNVSVGAAGTLVNAANSQLAAASNVTVNGGTYNLSGFDQTVNSLSMSGGQVLQSNTTGLGLTSGNVTVTAGSASVSGGLRSSVPYTFNVSSAASLSVTGSVATYGTAPVTAVTLIGGGTLTLSGSNPFATIDVKSGILRLSAGGSFLNVNSSVLVESGGTFSLNNQLQTIGDLNGAGHVALGSGNLTVLGSNGGTFTGVIDGTGTFTKGGIGTLFLGGNLAYTGPTNVSAGTLTLTAPVSSSVINIANGTTLNLNSSIKPSTQMNISGTVNIPANTPGAGINTVTIGQTFFTNTGKLVVATPATRSDRTLLVAPQPTFAGSPNAWAGQLDVGGNDMIVKSGNITTITNQARTGYAAGNWNGPGYVSSAAAANPIRTTALGIIVNTQDGGVTPLFGSGTANGLFDGYSPSTTDVLIKYTYTGDTNFDGFVDGSDYSRVDNGVLFHLTGWANGDFNYDGVTDGSDFTLMDNAFNNQGPAMGNIPAAAPTALLAALPTTAVPEPAALTIAMIAPICLRRRRRLG